MGSWFKTGEEASQYVNEESERSELAADSKFIRRWYMKKTPDDEDGKTITFVDDSKHPAGYPLPFVFWEHQIELNGRWTNWFTCAQGIEDAEGKEMQCPICASGRKPSLCAAYTIRNGNSYETKSGMKNLDGTELNLFVCKTKTQKIIQKSMRKRGSLRGWRVEVTRNGSGTDSANVGDVFEWEKQIELPDDVQPFPYHELFAPKTEQELKAILSGVAPASSQPKTSTPPIPAEDEVVRF